jgi:hypothetical protein
MIKQFKGWRRFLVEAVEGGKTAYFFDFDETLAFDNNPTFLYHLDPEHPRAEKIFDASGSPIIRDGEVVSGYLIAKITDQRELDKLTKKYEGDPTYLFDYSASEILNDPMLNLEVFKTFSKALHDRNNIVHILTARGDKVVDDIVSYLYELSEPETEVGDEEVEALLDSIEEVIREAYIITLGTGTYGTRNKGEFMVQRFMETPEIKNIVFYEDSLKNLADARDAFLGAEFTEELDKRAGNAVIYQVDHGQVKEFFSV